MGQLIPASEMQRRDLNFYIKNIAATYNITSLQEGSHAPPPFIMMGGR